MDFKHSIVDEGRLELLNIIGSGSFGVVYRAREVASSMEHPVYYAVKCLGPVSPAGSVGAAEQREIALHRTCSSHHRVVTLHRHFCSHGSVFVVLDLVANGHLYNAIRLGVFCYQTALVRKVFLQLLDAVNTCHQFGICHRDLKPENILCSYKGTRVRIADFGLAIETNNFPRPAAVGSLAYMTPGALGGRDRRKYDPRQSDIWALCVVLVNLISGHSPWQLAHRTDVEWQAFLLDPDYLRRKFPMSQDLSDLLRRCFSPLPQTRPSLSQLQLEFSAISELFTNSADRRLRPFPDVNVASALGLTDSSSVSDAPSFGLPATPSPSSPPTSISVEEVHHHLGATQPARPAFSRAASLMSARALQLRTGAPAPLVPSPCGKPLTQTPFARLRQWIKYPRRALQEKGIH
ncbi:kinase-like domain-containing protein [Mycena crocata]|nr:kinase-like domain-containing protein [Mycena crocata]